MSLLNQSLLVDMAHKPELLVFDLDGTAIQSDINARMSTGLISAINDAPANELRISIATGRSWEHFATVVDKVHYSLAPCIISGGSQIVDTTNSTILWEVQLTQRQISKLNAIAGKHNKNLSYNNKLNTLGPVEQMPNINRITIAYLLDIDSTELNKIHDEVSAIAGLHSAITHAWGDTGKYALHITSTDANKGAALRQLVDILDVPAREVVAIGDGLNDVPMFEIAGTSYSITGSVVEGSEYTSGTIPNVVNDGLAKYIAKLYNKYQ